MSAVLRPRAAKSRGKPPSRAERRRAARIRRNRLMLVSAAGVSVAVVVSWFPASELMHQHQQVAAAVTRLHRLHGQDEALSDEAKRLQTPSEVARIAEQQYGLAKPGQQLYQVLPASGSGSGTLATSGTAATRSGTAGGNDRRTITAGQPSGGFFSRVVSTLEFWH